MLFHINTVATVKKSSPYAQHQIAVQHVKHRSVLKNKNKQRVNVELTFVMWPETGLQMNAHVAL